MRALLEEYFMLKNKLKQNGDTTPDIKIYFAAAYNKDGDGKPWKQNFVKKCFSDEELLIGRDYWNFVCDAPDGYDVVIQAFNKYSYIIDNALKEIISKYEEKRKKGQQDSEASAVETGGSMATRHELIERMASYDPRISSVDADLEQSVSTLESVKRRCAEEEGSEDAVMRIERVVQSVRDAQDELSRARDCLREYVALLGV